MRSTIAWMILAGMAFMLGLFLDAQEKPAAAVSTWRLVEEMPQPDAKKAELAIEVVDTQAPPQPLPVRVIVTAADKSHPDGSGHGVYADGRFFAEGSFTVAVPPGQTKVLLRSGPAHVPLEMAVEAKAGKRLRCQARLVRWFQPEARGWYAGDNHVHAQHDAQAVIKTSLAYTALQARANGLSYITEAGSQISYEGKDRLDTRTFLFRHAQELRPGPFVGHLNTPGIASAIPKERLEQLQKQPLPAQAIKEVVHELKGALIHTHPLTPTHQLHWMGAAELYSDAVLGRCADALDVDSPLAEQLYFAVLNLRNRLAVSSYTDCALGRVQTLSPGDRRVWCHAKEFSYPAIVQALREGNTFAGNDGPLFPFFTINGREPGQRLEPKKDGPLQARAEIHSLYPLKTAEIISRGSRAHVFDVIGKKGAVVLNHALAETGRRPSWYLLRVEDERSNWVITSPIYVEPAVPGPRPFASAVLLGIGNYTRFIQLRKDFFAHLIVTVSPDDGIQEVRWLKDGQTLQSLQPDKGNKLAGKVPVTEIDGDYAPGWIWQRHDQQAVHFQADLPVKESGWYEVRVRTVRGRDLASDAVRFDSQDPNSHALSSVRLEGEDTRFVLHGYGEEMPLAEIQLPFAGDHWWYPRRTHWRLETVFGEHKQERKGGAYPEAAARFRPAAAKER